MDELTLKAQIASQRAMLQAMGDKEKLAAALARAETAEAALAQCQHDLAAMIERKEYFRQCWEQAETALAESKAPPRMIEGTLPADDLRRAFADGAKWWEFRRTGFTMWNSDCAEAEAEAEARFPNGKPRPIEVAP